MTIKEFTDYLYEAGYGFDELVFNIRGNVTHTQEIHPGMSGDYDFDVEIDHSCEVYDVNRVQSKSGRQGKVVVVLDIGSSFI